MKERLLKRLVRTELAPPAYLLMPAAGIDISTSGIKVAKLKENLNGIELVDYGETVLALGAIVGGEISDQVAVSGAIHELARTHHIAFANIAVSESRSYLFETTLEGDHRTTDSATLHALAEQHIDEYVPLPPAEVAFDLMLVSATETAGTVAGVGYAKRVIDEALATLDASGVITRAIESETFSMARALMPRRSTETVLLIDIGKTTTKLIVVTGQVPRFATTLEIGGHALTQAVMKHFNISEEEAKKVKAEQGLLTGDEKDEYVATMRITVSAIREEVIRRLEYWQGRAKEGTSHEPITRVVLTGGNATLRGLPEYLENAIKLPVTLGDVFTNLASREQWLPSVPYTESLAYGTAIGLALREFEHRL